LRAEELGADVIFGYDHFTGPRSGVARTVSNSNLARLSPLMK
jgi:hypothetical protein